MPAATERLFRYRVYCETEGAYVKSGFLPASESPPAGCPNDPGHTITVGSLTVVGRRGVEAKYDQQGALIAGTRTPVGGGIRDVRHNFCDACTWWQESAQITDESTTPDGAFTVYTLDNAADGKLVDLRHGRLTFEEDILPATLKPDGSPLDDLVPTVKLNGSPLDQALEDDGADPDGYTIDYAAGAVTFNTAKDPGDTVTVSARRAGSSKLTLQGAPGRKFILEDVELDVTEDIDMRASEGGGVVSVIFGSNTTLTGGAVVPVQTRHYKRFRDFHAAARQFYGPIPTGFGGDGGAPSPLWTFRWIYARADAIYATPNYLDENGLGASKITPNRIEISTRDDKELGGAYCILTFFGSEHDEDNGA